MAGCGRDKKDATGPNENPPDDSAYQASQTVTTTQEGNLRTESGAAMRVPRYAVPQTEGGSNGTMVFSIERDRNLTPTPPEGETIASDVYRFGPDGFTFANMVDITIPVTGDTTGKEVTVYRIDPNTGRTERVGGVYDPATRTITAQRYSLSPYVTATYSLSETAWGALLVDNTASGYWAHLCVQQFTLKYPQIDGAFDGNAWSTWAPPGTIGFASRGFWYLPQGSYKVCIEVSREGTVVSPPGPPKNYSVEVEINNPKSRNSPVSGPPDIPIVAPFGDAVDGPCNCTPIPTPPVGTGDVQVTLTWHNPSAIDLDLHIFEPDGTECYFGNPTTPSGGTLDRDNKCDNYVNGRPENIFWSSAPVGEYKIDVHWFGACGNAITGQAYDVRVVVKGEVKTYSGSLSADERKTVTTFTVNPGKVAAQSANGEEDGRSPDVFGPYLGLTVPSESGPPKE